MKRKVNQQEAIKKELSKLNNKLDSILNVRVNGTVGLEAALQELYEVTAGLRAKRNWRQATGQVLKTNKAKLLVPILTFLLGFLFANPETVTAGLAVLKSLVSLL